MTCSCLGSQEVSNDALMKVEHVFLHECVNVEEKCILMEVTLLLGNVKVFTLWVTVPFLHHIVVTRQFFFHSDGLRLHRHETVAWLHCKGGQTFGL